MQPGGAGRFAFPVISSLLLAAAVAQAQTGTALPMTGQAIPGMSSYDRLIPELMERYGIAGAAVAVSRNGRLVFARGYGYADKEAREPVAPDALFRLASVSKPITAVAILKLVEEGKLNLDAKALDILSHLKPAPGAQVDPRFRQVTIRQLLWHAGGWDRDRSGGFDPMFRPGETARDMGIPAPHSCETIIRWMMGKPLDFDPGTRSVYSNFGYCILGRVIEKVTGENYEEYVKKSVLQPMGIGRMRIGGTLLSERAPGEVRYYDFPGARLANSIFPASPGPVPAQYGAYDMRTLDSHGGWIASAIDLMRFVNNIEGRGRPAFLRQSTIQQMLARPLAPVAKPGTPTFYAMGWNVRPMGSKDANWWHGGSLPGTTTFLARIATDGMSWAALLNGRPENSQTIGRELDTTMGRAFREATAWPSHDLFSQFD
jgi:CubicO group peptidase (beta-lactamase class C family)